MVRKHFAFQLWRNKSKWIIKGTELKCSSLEDPILKSVYLITLLQKLLNCSLFLQFIRVSFSTIKVRKTGIQCITLSQYPKNCTRSPLLPQTPAWVCGFNSSCGDLWQCNELSSDLSFTDVNSKGRKLVEVGIKRVRQSKPCDLETREVREGKILRIKFVLTHFKMTAFFKIQIPHRKLCLLEETL